MANGETWEMPFGVPSAGVSDPSAQQGEGWWSRAIGGLGDIVAPPKGTDYGMLGSVLGRGAQAFSARDPQSWQHQLGGLGAEIGRAHKMGIVQEQEKKRKEMFRQQLLKAFGLDISQGETKIGAEAPVQPAEEDPFGLGPLTLDRSPLSQPKRNPVFDILGGT